MTGSKLQTNIEALHAFVEQQGWRVIEEKAIQYGYQITVSDGKDKIPVGLYESGKMLVQGKPGTLQNALKAWQDIRTSPGKQADLPLMPVSPQSSIATAPVTDYTGTPRIGGDESGKGDYFGPLVLAVVYVDARTEPELNRLGVRDSKQLTDKRILAMAEEIRQLCPNLVLALEPQRYNELYTQRANLNALLGWGYAWLLEQLLGKVSCRLAIIDKFGDESYILRRLQEKGRAITIEQRVRGEGDTAVAAASILTRARFVEGMKQLSERVGRALPKGASDPAILTTGRELVAQYGEEILTQVAKTHFKTTQEILAVR